MQNADASSDPQPTPQAQTPFAEAKTDVQRKTLDQRSQMDELMRLRHSCAHILATAVLRLWPDALLDIGPPTSEGFYYDFDLQHRFSPEDFPKIEEEMRKITKENQVFEKSVKTRAEALAYFEGKGQKFKVERLGDIPEGETITARSAPRWACSRSTPNTSDPDSPYGCRRGRYWLRNWKNWPRKPSSKPATCG